MRHLNYDHEGGATTGTYSLGTVLVSERPVERSYEREFGVLRHSEELAAEREKFEADLGRPPTRRPRSSVRCPAWDTTVTKLPS